jgi:gliding motility-associated-like protein
MNYNYRDIVLLLLTFGLSCLTTSLAQEICDNAIDDDADGFIDLNDPDCICNFLLPSSLIPNPSFEEMLCCPEENARLDCAVDWIQASNPTTDYVHTCGNYLGNTNIPAYAPLPFPDGEGGVGFRDGQAYVGTNYKEYVGACLTESMEVGTKYKLDFYIGFRNNVVGSMNLTMAIFGSTNCSDLPFGGNSNSIGCPVNSGKYKLIAQQQVFGSNEWVNVIFEFVADKAYEVIILGPGCEANPNYVYDPYFYLDRLVIAESAEFGIPFDKIEGRICEEGVMLSVEDISTNTFQWYKDGIAIIGESSPYIFLQPNPGVEGIYQCVITNSEGCAYSQAYELRIPPYYEQINDTICEFDYYQFGNQSLVESGYYERTIEALDGCDSIIQLNLEILPSTFATTPDSFCLGAVYNYYDITTNEPGTYQTNILNENGCDSMITVELFEIPMGTGILLTDTIILDLGEITDLIPEYLNPDYSEIKWLNEANEFITKEKAIFDFQPFNSTKLYLTGEDEWGCPVLDSTTIIVRKTNYTLYIPNIFTPNGDKLNDNFIFFTPPSIRTVTNISIYDRWGNKVFEDQNIHFPGNFQGWDGNINGTQALSGVYSYIIEAIFIDETEKIFSGDLTLIR